MKKSKLLEILDQYEEDVNIKVEYIGWDTEVVKGDCFNIRDIECGDMSIYLQIG